MKLSEKVIQDINKLETRKKILESNRKLLLEDCKKLSGEINKIKEKIGKRWGFYHNIKKKEAAKDDTKKISKAL